MRKRGERLRGQRVQLPGKIWEKQGQEEKGKWGRGKLRQGRESAKRKHGKEKYYTRGHMRRNDQF